METLAITQARYGSSRLPAKILKKIHEQTLLEIHIQRILKSQEITKLIVATTIEPESENIATIANKIGVSAFKGSIDDVLERFYFAAKLYNPKYVVRLTSDCPLIDARVIDEVVKILKTDKYDYVATGIEPTFPDGISIEAFTFKALEKAYLEAEKKSDREHVTPYIWRNSTLKRGNIFKSYCLKHKEDFSRFRLTVDELEDFELIELLIQKLGTDRKWEEYIHYIQQNPELFQINSKYSRNEGYKKSLLND